MTCLVGIVQGRHVWLGADSLGVDGDSSCFMLREPKAFRVGKGAFANSGDAAWGSTLRHCFRWPSRPAGEPVDKYMSTRVRRALKRLWEDQYDAADYSCRLLAAYSGQLYLIDTAFMAFRADRYMAAGSGDAAALGSLHTTEGTELSPPERIAKALAASAEFNTGVRAPWVIVRC